MSLPEPLTPPEADLQDFPFMPLPVARLRDSDLAAEELPEACWYAVLLWAASWHQLPAGSLPDNDTVLMRLCGLGRDTRTWKKHRDGALRGFVKCSDGRLYHPVVAEQVVAAWEGKRQQRWRTECARIKKANQRNGTDNPLPTFEQFVAGDTPVPVPDVSLGTAANVPEDNASKGQGERKGQGQGDNNIGVVERTPALDPDIDWPSDLVSLTEEVTRIAGVRHVEPGAILRNQDQVKRWIDAGFDPAADIVPVIQQTLVDTPERINSLAYFDAPIRQTKARKEAAENGHQPASRAEQTGPVNPLVRAVAARRARRADVEVGCPDLRVSSSC